MEIEHLWLQEAACRAEMIDKGLVQRIPADIVYQEASAFLQ